MALETRHTEKNILSMLLMIEQPSSDVEMVISHLTAMMEPEDVELVEKRVAEAKARKKA